MTLSTADLAHVLLAMGLLLTFAHGCGYVLERCRQPRVVGEILGGLLLGPTLAGSIFPRLESWIFPQRGSVPLVLDAVYQLGLLLLMFSAGAELRGLLHREEIRVVGWVSILGMVIPLAVGTAVVLPLRFSDLRGPSAGDAAFVIVFAVAVAITSIPVISRIMFDLGILETSFARVVLGVAVVEDVVLYVLLAIALGLVSRGPGDVWGLPFVLGLRSGSGLAIGYHTLAEITFLAGLLMLGRPLYRWMLRPTNLVKRGNPIGFQLVFLFGCTLLALWLGVAPLLGAFAAGIVVSASSGEGAARARGTIRAFSFALFVPVYFAVVGLRLDLVKQFDLGFFVPFFLLACATKLVSVYAGSRLAGEPPSTCLHLSVALNARGGPGIVLASVALDAGIINGTFYSALVMLAVLTSVLAGAWLGRVIRGGGSLRDDHPGGARRESGDRKAKLPETTS